MAQHNRLPDPDPSVSMTGCVVLYVAVTDNISEMMK